jgi:hypothetical protein
VPMRLLVHLPVRVRSICLPSPSFDEAIPRLNHAYG